MKDFMLSWGIFLVALVVFCMSIHFMICFSVWWGILFFISLCWIIVMIIYSIKLCDFIEEKERVKTSKFLYGSGFFSLLLGTVCVLNFLGKEQYEITKTIGTFLFCYFAVASFFGNIMLLDQSKNEKNLQKNGRKIYRKNDKKWIGKSDAILVFSIL